MANFFPVGELKRNPTKQRGQLKGRVTSFNIQPIYPHKTTLWCPPLHVPFVPLAQKHVSGFTLNSRYPRFSGHVTTLLNS